MNMSELFDRGRSDGEKGRKRKTYKIDAYARQHNAGYDQGVKDNNWCPGGVSTFGYHPGGVPIASFPIDD